MMLRTCRVAILFLFLTIYFNAFSQQKWPNTFLWKISGNGLTKPSYLFGTIHLQDKRLFNFGDSLYHSLQNVEGFALEIDFKEYMDRVFSETISREEEKYLNEDEEVDVPAIETIPDTVVAIDEVMPPPSPQLTRKDWKKIRQKILSKYVQKGEMPTIVDGYLYGVALRLGKWTGAVEDVADQLNMADELGMRMDTSELFEPEEKLRISIEDMIRVYINQDMEKLAKYADGYDRGWKDMVLTRRNLKMAQRMDSLSFERSMFYAVGAAHLPGDSGVINLLRKKGFTVEPVFSSQKIAASTFTSTLKKLPWQTIEDENRLYTIQMPGQPSLHNVMGQIVKMKIFFDLPSMTFYMAGTSIGRLNNQKDIDKAFNEIARSMGSFRKPEKTKYISEGALKGKEGIIDGPQGYYHVRLLQKDNNLFFLLAGTEKKTNLSTTDVNRFFSSFQAHDIVISEKKWKFFQPEGKAFEIHLPGEPQVNHTFDRVAEESNFNVQTHDLVDVETGLYYMIQVRDLKKGFFLDGDSSYFSRYTEEMKGKMKTNLSRTDTCQGFPCLYYDFSDQDDRVSYKSLHIIRGNRIYLFMVGGQNGVDFKDGDHFLQSLKLTDYGTSIPKQYETRQFVTKTSHEFVEILPEEGEETGNRIHYISYNPIEVISYEVLAEPLPELYWTDDENAFLEKQFLNYKKVDDSIISKKNVINGGLRGMEAIIQQVQNNNLRKMRVFVNGDTIYTLTAFIPLQYIDEPRHKHFFTDFRVKNEKQPWIYKNRSREFFQKLSAAKDSGFYRLSATLNSVEFSQKDLPVLHEAMLMRYYDSDSSFYNTNDRIITKITEVADSTTIEFIGKNYLKLKEENEALKYPLMGILASIKTQESYDLLKKLMLQKLPSKGSASFGWRVTDSLKLAATLFPEILIQTTDSSFSHLLVQIINTLTDSGYLKFEDVLPYRDNFLKHSGAIVKAIKLSPEDTWQYYQWIPFMGRFNDESTNEMLEALLNIPLFGLKTDVIIALLKNGREVNPTLLEEVAFDKEGRGYLYDRLKTIKKQELFPSRYASQQSLAESELYNMISEEYEVSSINYIGERISSFNGKMKKFHLFRFSIADEEGYEYLGVTGPYDPESKELLPFTNASGYYFEQAYEKKNIDVLLKEYLKQMEEFIKE